MVHEGGVGKSLGSTFLNDSMISSYGSISGQKDRFFFIIFQSTGFRMFGERRKQI